VADVIQSVDYLAISPPLLVALTALACLLLDLLLPPARARAAVPATALAGVVVATIPLLALRSDHRSTFCVPATRALPRACSYVVDDLTLVLQTAVLGAAVVVLLLSWVAVRRDRMPSGEYHVLLLSSLVGAVSLPASRDLLTLVVSLELLSLPTFALAGLRREDGRSSEAALKLFLVSVVSTAVMLFGFSLLYGVTGSVHLDRIAAGLRDPGELSAVASVGVALSLAGFGFKVAAVPFHTWAPDVYVGAPLPVTAYLSVVSKVAGFAGLGLLVTRTFPTYAHTWAPVLAVVAALTMTVGNLVALRQRHAVRLLAWSSVAQSGYMLVPLGAAATGDPERAFRATVAYLLAYAAMNLAAFAVVAVVGRSHPDQRLDDYRGLAGRQPVAAASLALALVALAGLPPGVVGLVVKVVVFAEPVRAGTGWLAVVMAVNVVIGLAYYLRWAAALFVPVTDPAAEADAGERPALRLAPTDALAVGLTLVAVIVISVAPALVVDALG